MLNSSPLKKVLNLIQNKKAIAKKLAKKAKKLGKNEE